MNLLKLHGINKGEFGEAEMGIPRDRKDAFEPQLIPKGQTRLNGFDDKILSLYARGMTSRDIQAQYVTVESCTQQDNEAYLKLCLLNQEASCPCCNKLSSELHQDRPILILDLSIFGQANYLKSSASSVLLP